MERTGGLSPTGRRGGGALSGARGAGQATIEKLSAQLRSSAPPPVVLIGHAASLTPY